MATPTEHPCARRWSWGVAGGQGQPRASDGTGAGKQERYCSRDLRRAEQNPVSLGAPPASGGHGTAAGGCRGGSRSCRGDGGHKQPRGHWGTAASRQSSGIPSAFTARGGSLRPQERAPVGRHSVWVSLCAIQSVPRAPGCPQRSATRVSTAQCHQGTPSAVPPRCPQRCPPGVSPAQYHQPTPSIVPPGSPQRCPPGAVPKPIPTAASLSRFPRGFPVPGAVAVPPGCLPPVPPPTPPFSRPSRCGGRWRSLSLKGAGGRRGRYRGGPVPARPLPGS